MAATDTAADTETPRPRLAHRVFLLLRNGDTSGAYGGDSLRITGAIVADAARAGHDLEHLRALLLDERNAGGEWYRAQHHDRGRLRATRTLERLLNRSIANHRTAITGPTDARERITFIRAAALASPWPGRTGTSRRKVLLAHTDIAMKTGSLRYAASSRQIAEGAEISRNTVDRCHRTLCTDGYLRRLNPPTSTTSGTWHLLEAQWTKPAPLEPAPGASPIGTRLTAHPAFRHGTGLDAQLWYALDPDSGATTAELTTRLGISVESTRRKLLALERPGPARRHDDRTWTRTGDEHTLDEIAERTGMTRRSLKQRRNHQRDRDRHRESLAALAQHRHLERTAPPAPGRERITTRAHRDGDHLQALPTRGPRGRDPPGRPPARRRPAVPLQTPALLHAERILRDAHHHLGTTPCPERPRPENRLQHLAATNARATAADIAELERAAEQVADRAERDLATTHHLLAAHTSCRTCRTLGRDAARLHLELGDQQ